MWKLFGLTVCMILVCLQVPRLTDEGLLKKCSRGKIQNRNESLDSIVWKLCNKTVFAGRNNVETAVSFEFVNFPWEPIN